MHPDSDHLAVRRVLAQTGVTAAAAALSVAAAVPALAGTHGAATDRSQSAAAHDKAATHDGSHHGSATGGANTGSGHNPPGNNGTVKIHDVANDPSHHNVPHVSCDFYVDFWGFDANQQMTVSFAGQAPTGPGTPVTFTALSPGGYTDTSTTDAGGGNDFDGELGFSASQDQLSVLGAPQPQQGYHIKMTVDTGAPGGHKYKVFWIQPCASSGETGGTTPGGGGETGGTTPGGGGETGGTTPGGGGETGGTTPGGGGESGGGSSNGAVHHAKARSRTAGKTNAGTTAVLGEKVSRAMTSPQSPNVLGTSVTRSAAAPTSLPFTGSEIAAMTLAGAASLAGGAGLAVAGRRRRRAVRHRA